MKCRLCCWYRSRYRRPFLTLTLLVLIVVVWSTLIVWTKGAWSQSEVNVIGVRNLHPANGASNVSKGQKEGGITDQFKVQIPYANVRASSQRLPQAPLSTMQAPLPSTHQRPLASTPLGVMDDDVLDKKGIKIMPRAAVVPEGHALQVSCVTAQLLARQEGRAPYLTFEFPPMDEKYEKKIAMALRPGAAVLKFQRILREHGGRYRCVATDDTGRRTYNAITINVIPGEGEHKDKNRNRELVQGPREEWLEEIEELEAAGNAKTPKMELKDLKELKELKERLEQLKTQVRNASNLSAVDLKQLMDRGKMQQASVMEFCRKYNLSHLAGVLPTTNASAHTLYRHVLLNDKAQTAFCFAPKAGCTNLRLLFFLVLGYIPLSQFLQSRDGVDQNRLESAQFAESFYSRNNPHRLYALKHYFKFVMYRHPLERLVSGFRSKVERYPLMGLSENKPHFNWLRKAIFLHTHPDRYNAYLRARGKTAVNITFPDFIEYWLSEPPKLKYDEHFRSISSLCQPCRTQFTFYANFKHFDVDSQLLVAKIKARPEYLRQSYYTGLYDSTAALAPTLYAQLTQEQKIRVLKFSAQELDFFYHIFPEEVNSHRNILGLDFDLPEPVLV